MKKFMTFLAIFLMWLFIALALMIFFWELSDALRRGDQSAVWLCVILICVACGGGCAFSAAMLD